MIQGVTKLELGCGYNKREGFFGIDIAEAPGVDLMLDYEKCPLPLPDDSVDEVYSSHSFEHINAPQAILRELLRVCKDGAIIQIWTPYGKSDDGMLFGHHNFYSEASFKHICFEYDRFYLGDSPGFLCWTKTHYNLHPAILADLDRLSIPLDFAIRHMFNIAVEWGVFLKVDKSTNKAPGPQYPLRVYSVSGRQGETAF